MLKSNIFKILGVSIVTSSLVFAPYSIKTNFTNAEEKVVAKPVKEISFVSNKKTIGNVVEKLKVKKDDSLGGLKKNLKEKSIKVQSLKISESDKMKTLTNSIKNTNVATDIVAKVEEVESDKKLRNYLRQKVKEGNKVILYGNVTYDDYKKLLKIDSLKVKDKNKKGYYTFGEATEENKGKVNKFSTSKNNQSLLEDGSDKGPLKDGVIDPSETTSIIGYSLDESKDNQYIDINIMSYDEKGNLRENDEEVYIQEILNYESELTDKIQDEVEGEVTEATKISNSFFRKNITDASRKMVDSDYGIKGTVYGEVNQVVGRMTTDFKFFKHSDSNSKYDYFTLRPLTQLTHHNGALAQKLVTTLEPKYAGDQLDNWSPKGDTKGSDFDLSMGFPFSISVGMSFKDSVTIDDQSSIAYDYARWKVTDGSLDGEVFEGMAGFATTEKPVIVFLQNLATFYIGPSNQYPANGFTSTQARYSY